ncbi:MAG: acyl CoA:acetate/3-ketoacid CoA transferase [candidate division NC10 bacterium]|nr:acyl CoA:acetate/3-ketoacid CoA transferase [candidate division NC10 bacterium]
MSARFLSADEAVRLIPNGATLVIGGTGAVLEPDLVLHALERRFLETGEPKDLVNVNPMLPSDRPGEGGLNVLAHEGMLRRIIGGSYTAKRHPRLIRMILEDRIEAYNLPMGTLVQWLTAVGAGKPGVLTQVGLHTFVDPRLEGGRLNDRTTENLAEVMTIRGQEYLFYPTFPVDVAIVRGTTADQDGNISMEEEPNTLGMTDIAMAARNSGGTVIAQVKRVAKRGTLDPRLVRIPAPLVDAVVVHRHQTQLTPATPGGREGHNPALCGDARVPLDTIPPLPLDGRKVILRRAARELRRGDVVNLGAGLATELPVVALEEGVLDAVTFTNEHGIFGGLMGSAIGTTFVVALNPDAIMDSTFQFNYYDGGGLDITFLGVGQLDGAGNNNVSRFGEEITGCGGFHNITDRARRIVFCTFFTAGGLEVDVTDGRLKILREGKHPKLVERVEQLTFNAARAHAKGQQVTYVTERAVFRLTAEGLTLVEVAPGVDVERDIRARMRCPLRVAPDARPMDAALFRPEPLGLAAQI